LAGIGVVEREEDLAVFFFGGPPHFITSLLRACTTNSIEGERETGWDRKKVMLSHGSRWRHSSKTRMTGWRPVRWELEEVVEEGDWSSWWTARVADMASVRRATSTDLFPVTGSDRLCNSFLSCTTVNLEKLSANAAVSHKHYDRKGYEKVQILMMS